MAQLSFHIVLLNESIYVWLFQLMKTFDGHCVYRVIAGLLSIHLGRFNGWPSRKLIVYCRIELEWLSCVSLSKVPSLLERLGILACQMWPMLLGFNEMFSRI